MVARTSGAGSFSKRSLACPPPRAHSAGIQTRLGPIALTAALFGLAACALIYKSDTPGNDAKGLVAAGATLVDVRTPEEYAEQHIDGAKNIPVDELAQRLSEIPRGQAVVVYCRSGRRSARAAEMLQQAGYANVHNLGPMSAWEE